MSRLARAASLALLVPAALSAQSEQRSIRGADVAIYNLVGSIRAEPGTGDAVTVEIRRGGADGAKLRIETGPVRGRETLRVIYPSDRIVYGDSRWGGRTSIEVRDDGTFSDGDWRERDGERVSIRSRGDGLEAHADLLVRVPRGQKLALYLAVGRAEVSNVNGNLYVDVGSAGVDVRNSGGSLSLDTGSGRVMVADFAGNVSVESGSGGVSLDRIKGAELHIESGSGGIQASEVDVAKLDAEVGSGGLRLYRTKAPRLNLETGSGGAVVELLSTVEEVTIETGSGGVTLRTPATLSAEVDIETGSGGFDTDFAITTTRMGRNHVQGRIGDGKGRIQIEAGSGTVRLLKS